MEKKKYPMRAEDYRLFEMVGQGVSASVRRALCVPFDEVVAIKILDFERDNSDLNNISREAQIMLLIDHPNVLKAHCSFVNDHNLWVVMPYMAGGSCLHIMKSVYPNGFEEVVIATILREALKGLVYLHHHGHIHRDVKAGNILVDSKGRIKLGDFGVSASLFDSGDRQRSRNTFVGTPCWMAPEVMEQLHGYDFKADIWSFGITALELAHGHAPFSKYPPMKVLLMTLQNAPPGLDYERDRKFSRSFKHMIAMCLVKDPTKRPSAQKLLKEPFFKQARSHDYISRKILEGLPTLGDRHQALKEKEEDMLAQKKIPYGKKEELSQNEYKRGISIWNFDIDDLRTQASLISDNEENNPSKDRGGSSNSLFELEPVQERMSTECMTSAASFSSKDDDDIESDGVQIKSPPPLQLDLDKFYQRTKSDVSDCDFKVAEPNCCGDMQTEVQLHRSDRENECSGSCELEIDEKSVDVMPSQRSHEKRLSASSSSSELCNPSHERRFSISSCTSDSFLSSKGESLKQQNLQQNMGNCNGDVSQTVTEMPAESVSKASKSSASTSDDLDDKSKPPVVQQKGRFKVTSEKVDLEKLAIPSIGLQKSHSMQVISQVTSPTVPSPSDATPIAGSLFQHMLSILQTSTLQKDYALSVMKQLCTGEQSVNRSADGPLVSVSTVSLLEAVNEREKELLQEVTDLQLRIISKDEEIQKLKARLAQANIM
ncbi:uncharacterized protein A4U43_C01F34390 [Asparagus officinalis]|uniref:Protein kinase domain-containing protein n=1 Tax=Asparagus officinalis TaxID=4686 RepID=A0A5P1FXN4_ASPOF|nr:serine/threonine-protein kinase BLUS1 [Asparagus officinalis]ONK81931.1 uncharacterized protein A4U43_C01F34390 [Asparagus officinalis]